jgi:hypothetical protein
MPVATGPATPLARPHLCLRSQGSKVIQIYCDSTNPSKSEIAESAWQRDPRAAQQAGRQLGNAGRRGRDHQEHALLDRAWRRQPVLGNRRRNREGARGVRGEPGKALRKAPVALSVHRSPMKPGCDHNEPERLGIARKASEHDSESEPKIWLHTGKSPAPQGTAANAPDGSRTRDLRLERPTLFGPPKGPVDH